MNNMEKVAEILGVKLGERFKVNGCVYCFSEYGLVDSLDGTWATVLAGLLTGNYTIEKLPWKPQENDKYWYISIDGDALYSKWTEHINDYAMYYAGNCFETYEEASAHVPEIIEKLRKKYEES